VNEPMASIIEAQLRTDRRVSAHMTKAEAN
jgi:hypothetical protein